MSLRASAQNLVKAYRKNLEPSLQDELIICHEPCNSAFHQTKRLWTWTVPSDHEVGHSWLFSSVAVIMLCCKFMWISRS